MAFKERIFRRRDEAAAPADEPATASDDEVASTPPPGDEPAAEDAGADTPAVDEQHTVIAPAAAAGEHDAAAQDATAQDAAEAEPAPGETAVMPAVDPETAAAAPVVPAGRPGFRERGRMRRRLRYLREIRELGYRDLGGLVFDQHRFGRPNEALVQGKVNAIDAIDRESRALGAALEDRAAYSELRVAGVSACQRCGGLHGSDARFCPSCGLAFGGPRTVAGVWADHPLPPAGAAPETELAPAADAAPLEAGPPAPAPAPEDPAP